MIGLDWDVVDLVDSLPEIKLMGIIDPLPPTTPSPPYLGNDGDWNAIAEANPHLKAILSVDHPKMRAKLFFDFYGEAALTIQSPNAYVSSRAFIDQGCIVQRGVTIMPHVQIGKGCKININATVHHEAKIGSFVTLAPGCQILGKVAIENQVYIGAGAIIKQKCSIGAGSIVGAGAVVVKNIPPNTTVVGVPAKPMKSTSLTSSFCSQ